MSHLQNRSNSKLTIACKDIILREYQIEDVDALHKLTWQPHFHEFLTGWNVPKEQREEWFANYEIPENERFLEAIARTGNPEQYRLRLGVILKETGEFIGICGTGIKDELSQPNREVFYGISEQYQNKGYTTQAVRGLITYLFENTQVEQLIAIAHIRNVSSNKVIQKCGFQFQRDVIIESEEHHYYKLQRE
ncbi:GNAT family N-acetyltransferase [Paenibacillus agilis]|uniref:GNAT family N-acetyltransferase n=1 Tax=Paenibacillus agilis TaxID=3020863 RepID=A0A559IVL6_9BACL|nr:GNAT family N-acetyltransferase [Paenibacillus agilis]TVX91641.1 GNAT family N-acetyltransferase [Paenibacillus agilis]